MNKESTLALRERYIYDVQFDSTSLSSDSPEDDYYEEVVYYDGGGVEGYGDSKKN